MTRISIAMLKLSTAIALVGCAALVVSDASAQKAGVATAVNQDADRTPPGSNRRQVVIGDEIVYNELIETSPIGQAQVLMLDRTALTVGPNASLVIDKFVYDPSSKTGDMGLTLRRGLLRFVGGAISKKTQARVNTPTGVLGLRGGVALVDVIDGNTVDATFLFGDNLTMIQNGQEIGQILSPGFKSRITRDGASEPVKVSPQEIAQKMGLLQGRAGAAGGLEEEPSSELVSSQAEAAMQSGNPSNYESGIGAGDFTDQTDLNKDTSDAQDLIIDTGRQVGNCSPPSLNRGLPEGN